MYNDSEQQKDMGLGEIFRLARERFTIITSILGDLQARVIALAFYFTILVPFALPMRRLWRGEHPRWLERAPLEHDLDAARRQG